jgi:hypothetical protein
MVVRAGLGEASVRESRGAPRRVAAASKQRAAAADPAWPAHPALISLPHALPSWPADGHQHSQRDERRRRQRSSSAGALVSGRPTRHTSGRGAHSHHLWRRLGSCEQLRTEALSGREATLAAPASALMMPIVLIRVFAVLAAASCVTPSASSRRPATEHNNCNNSRQVASELCTYLHHTHTPELACIYDQLHS